MISNASNWCIRVRTEIFLGRRVHPNTNAKRSLIGLKATEQACAAALRSGALPIRGLPHTMGPGSAVHHFMLRRARETQCPASNARFHAMTLDANLHQRTDLPVVPICRTRHACSCPQIICVLSLIPHLLKGRIAIVTDVGRGERWTWRRR
jgi:hypothetical protein